MVTRRTAKSKGAQFEYDVAASLQQKFPDVYLTKQQGFTMQYDLQDETEMVVYECKFHKTISWNQAKKLYHKLESMAPDGYESVLIYKTNQQPVLVMHRHWTKIRVSEFEDVYGVPFIKHETIKRRKKNE